MIADTIQGQIQAAMKAHDELRVSTLKLLSSALSYEKIALMHDLNEEEEMAVVQKEVKKRKDAIALYEKAAANDKAQKEKDELVILKEFLPPEPTDEEVAALVESAITETSATTIRDMGKVLALVKEKSNGLADSVKAAQMAKEKLL